jgi:hypothetical protein
MTVIPQNFKDGGIQVKEEKYRQGEFDHATLHTCM